MPSSRATKRHLRLMKAAARPGLSRERITAAALSLIDREGLEALTMRGLAKELGVDPMAVYRHFSGKGELVDGVRAAVLADFEAGTSARVTARSSGAQRLLALGHQYIGFAETKAAQFTLLFDSLPLTYRSWAQLRRESWIYDAVLDQMRAAVAEGGIKEAADMSTEERAFAFWALVHGFAILALTREGKAAGEHRDLHRSAMEAVLSAEELRTPRDGG